MVKSKKMHEGMLDKLVYPVVNKAVLTRTFINDYWIAEDDIAKIQLVRRLHNGFTFGLRKGKNIRGLVNIPVFFVKRVHLASSDNRYRNLNRAVYLLL